MPREVTMEEQSAAVRVVPPTRQQLSTAHLRSLLNALRHTPVSVIQRVGFLLVLVVSVVEASGLTDCASSAISIAGSAAGAAARDGIVITKDEQERAVKILAIAKANWARVTDLVGVEGEGSALGAVPVLEMETLRRWAVRRNRGVPRLLCLLRAASDIGLDDALLVQHHAAEISPREAGKALSAAAAVLAYVTRVSGDAIAKAHAAAAATNGFIEESDGGDALQEPHHHGANTDHRYSKEETIPADVAAALTRAAVVRVQAFVRGIAPQRAFGAVKAAATLIQTCERARRARRETASRFTAAAAVRVQAAAAVTMQGLWRGVMCRDELFCKTVAAVTVQRWTRTTIAVIYLARIRTIAQAHAAHVLEFTAVCVEFRFRAMCHLSVSMSAHSRPYRTASMLIQRRWTTAVKTASLVAQCHVFDEAESLLRSLVRQRSQQARFVGVARASTAERWIPGFASGNTSSTLPMTMCPEVQDESWLESAEEWSRVERARDLGSSDRENSGASCSNDINCAKRQRSCDEKTPIETGVSIDMAGVTLGASASIESLSPPTSDSLPASDSIAASNRPINDNHPSPLLGVDLPGSQLAPPAFVDRGHSEPQKTSTHLLSKGCINNTPHPPNLGRPVRLPIDAPELQFAPIPIIFDFEPDATPASSPGLDGPVKGSVPLPTNNKGVHAPAVPPVEVHRGPEGGQLHNGSLGSSTGSRRDCSQSISPSSVSDALHATYSTPDKAPIGDGGSYLADNNSGQESPESPVGEAAVATDNSTRSGGSLVGTLSTSGSSKDRESLSPSTLYDTGDVNAAIVRSSDDGLLRSSPTGLPNKVESLMDRVFDALRKTTNNEHRPTSDMVSIGSPASSGEDDTAASPLGRLLPESAPRPSPFAKNTLPTGIVHDSSMQLPLGGLSTTDNVHSTELCSSAFSLQKQRTPPVAQQPDLHLAVGKTMPLVMAWERDIGGVREPLQATKGATITLDQAIVWPFESPTPIGLATGTADAAQSYGGGQTTGCNEDVVLSAGSLSGTASNVTEEDSRHGQPEPPANNADQRMGYVGEVSIVPLVRSSEYDTVASTPGSAVPESTPPPPAYIKSALPTGMAHEPSLQLPLDGLNSTGGARSTELRQSAFSLPEQPAAPLVKQPALQHDVGTTMPLMMAWNKDNGGIGEQLPATKVATITLDQAIVWPSGSPTQIGLAAGTADGAETYGGGQITGCNGDVVLGAGCLSGTASNVTEEDSRHGQPEPPANNADQHMGYVGEVSIVPLVRSSEYDTVASTPGSAVPESTPPPPAYIKSALPTGMAHEPSLQLPPDGLNSTGGARSTELRQSAFSLPEQPAAPLVKQPALQHGMGTTMPLMMAWNKDNGGVGEQLPSTDVATITLDQAIVWPSGSPTQIGLATWTADEAQAYGGGQITGCNGDAAPSAGCLSGTASNVTEEDSRHGQPEPPANNADQHMGYVGEVSIVPLVRSSEYDTVASTPGSAVPESTPPPPAYIKSALPTGMAHEPSLQLPPDGLNSTGGARSTELRQLAFSLPEQPAAPLAKQPALQHGMGTTMPLMMAWNKDNGGIGEQLPSTDVATITLDQAIVWPSGSPTQIGLATWTADEAQAYGGGQITGCNGDAAPSAGCLEPLTRYFQKPGPSRISFADKTPHAGTRSASPTQPTTPVSPEEGQCCGGSPSHAAGRPRGRSWWIPFSDVIGHAVRTPPPLPGWRPAGGVGAILKEEEGSHDQSGPPAGNADLHMGDADEVFIMSLAPPSKNDTVASPLGTRLPEYVPTPSAPVKSILPTGIAHGASMQLSLNGLGSADVVRSTELLNAACSLTEQPESSVAMQPALHLAVGKAMASLVGWERVTGGIGGQLPTIEEETDTLDEAIVCPSRGSTDIDLATETADEAHVYGGGQIIGCNGAAILSAPPLALPLEEPLTPSPGRMTRSAWNSTFCTPSSSATTSPSAHSSPRRRRRREGSTSPAGRPRNLSRSVSPSDTRSAITRRRSPPTGSGHAPSPLNSRTTATAKDRLCEYDTVASTPGSAVPESTPPPPAYIKSALPTGIAHEPSLQLPPDGLNSTGGARSTELRQTAFSLPEQPAAPLAKQLALQLGVGKTMPLMTAWNKDNGGVGEQLPTTDVATITLDQAIVWPSGSPTQIGLATWTADEAQAYSGGQINGCNGDVVSSTGCLSHAALLVKNETFERRLMYGVKQTHINEVLQIKPAAEYNKLCDRTPTAGTRPPSPYIYDTCIPRERATL
eukprot:jgi/Undpi1/10149/HiC_scaffold_28.g12603.m1